MMRGSQLWMLAADEGLKKYFSKVVEELGEEDIEAAIKLIEVVLRRKLRLSKIRRWWPDQRAQTMMTRIVLHFPFLISIFVVRAGDNDVLKWLIISGKDEETRQSLPGREVQEKVD